MELAVYPAESLIGVTFPLSLSFVQEISYKVTLDTWDTLSVFIASLYFSSLWSFYIN